MVMRRHTFKCLGRIFRWYLWYGPWCAPTHSHDVFLLYFAIYFCMFDSLLIWRIKEGFVLHKKQIYRIQTFIFLIMYGMRPLNDTHKNGCLCTQWRYRNSAMHIQCSSGRKSSSLLRFPQGRGMGEQWKGFGALKWKPTWCFSQTQWTWVFRKCKNFCYILCAIYTYLWWFLFACLCIIFLHLSSHRAPPRWQAVIQGRPEQLETQLVPVKEAFGVADSELQEFLGWKNLRKWGIGVNMWYMIYYYIDVCFINIYMHVLLFVSQVFFLLPGFFHHFFGIWDRFPFRTRWNGGYPKYFTSIPGNDTGCWTFSKHDVERILWFSYETYLYRGYVFNTHHLHLHEDQHETEWIRRAQAEEGWRGRSCRPWDLWSPLIRWLMSQWLKLVL